MQGEEGIGVVGKGLVLYGVRLELLEERVMYHHPVPGQICEGLFRWCSHGVCGVLTNAGYELWG